MLEMRNISKRYRTELVETRALEGVDLTVAEREFVALVGPSGSGKTTFLNVSGLLESFDEGTYVLDGSEVSALNDRQRSTMRNKKIGFIFQNFNLIPDLNVFDNIDLPLRYGGVPTRERKDRIESVLETVGLQGRIRHYPAQLSGGQQQRIAIARALVVQPRLLLADEPTGNLDSNTATGVFDLLLELHANGSTILMVTHSDAMTSSVTRTVHIRDGSIQDS